MSQGFFLDLGEIGDTSRKNKLDRVDTAGRIIKGCAACSLDRHCRHPQMEPYGNGILQVAIVGEAPGATEDEIGRPFVGKAGKFLREAFEEFGIDVDEHCIVTNVVQCRPPNNEFPKDPAVVENCLSRLYSQLDAIKPKLIFACGTHAVNAILKPPFSVTMEKMRGFTIPSQRFDCWVSCIQHPSYVMRKEGQNKKDEFATQDARKVWVRDISSGLEYLEEPLPTPLNPKSYRILKTVSEVKNYFSQLIQEKKPVALDYETNTIDVFREKIILLSVAFSTDPSEGVFLPLRFRSLWSEEDYFEVCSLLVEFLESDVEKVIQNSDYERNVSKVALGAEINGPVWDTMITNHILDERKDINGMEFMVFKRWGIEYKGKVNHTQMHLMSMETMAEYNCLDSRYELAEYIAQKRELGSKQRTAADLFNQCSRCLSNMRYRGIKLDGEVLSRISEEIETQLATVNSMLKSFPVCETFKKEKGRDFNLGSGKDVREMLYDVLSVTPGVRRTAGKNLPVDDEALTEILESNPPEQVKTLIKLVQTSRKYNKQKSTYIDGLISVATKELILHPCFLLHTARSFRSSSEDPNLQNFPKRDEELRKMRVAVIPQNDLFLEADFKGAEVGVMAMRANCRRLKQQLADGVDPHRYWAAILYKVPEDKVTKDQRFVGKNGFVFPLFYGSWSGAISKATGVPLKDVEEAEARFWREYPEIKRYQEEAIAFYEKNGYLETLLGFRRHAPLSKNQIINTEIQGLSFQILLAGLQRLDDEMISLGMKSFLCGEVHDSGLIDLAEDELDETIVLVRDNLTFPHFEWMKGTRISVDISVGPNWFEMVDV